VIVQRIIWSVPINKETGEKDPNGVSHSDWMKSRDLKSFLAQRPFLQSNIEKIESREIDCDHYWLVRRGGHCSNCGKDF